MKATKTQIYRGLTGGVLAAVITAATPAAADDRFELRRGSFDGSEQRTILRISDRDRYERDSRYDRYDRRLDNRSRYSDRYRNSGPIKVRLRYDADGHGQVPLKRLLRNQHGLNPDDWRIRSINIRNKSRRAACADLTIGGRSTGPVHLRRGITTIAAPRGRLDGRWALGFENAKVRDVSLVLEPRRSSRDRYRNGKRHDDHAWRGTFRRGLAYRD